MAKFNIEDYKFSDPDITEIIYNYKVIKFEVDVARMPNPSLQLSREDAIALAKHFKVKPKEL